MYYGQQATKRKDQAQELQPLCRTDNTEEKLHSGGVRQSRPPVQAAMTREPEYNMSPAVWHYSGFGDITSDKHKINEIVNQAIVNYEEKTHSASQNIGGQLGVNFVGDAIEEVLDKVLEKIGQEAEEALPASIREKRAKEEGCHKWGREVGVTAVSCVVSSGVGVGASHVVHPWAGIGISNVGLPLLKALLTFSLNACLDKCYYGCHTETRQPDFTTSTTYFEAWRRADIALGEKAVGETRANLKANIEKHANNDLQSIETSTIKVLKDAILNHHKSRVGISPSLNHFMSEVPSTRSNATPSSLYL